MYPQTFERFSPFHEFQDFFGLIPKKKHAFLSPIIPIPEFRGLTEGSGEIPKNPWKSPKIPENPQESPKIPENPQKSQKMSENPRKSQKVQKSPKKNKNHKTKNGILPIFTFV